MYHKRRKRRASAVAAAAALSAAKKGRTKSSTTTTSPASSQDHQLSVVSVVSGKEEAKSTSTMIMKEEEAQALVEDSSAVVKSKDVHGVAVAIASPNSDDISSTTADSPTKPTADEDLSIASAPLPTQHQQLNESGNNGNGNGKAVGARRRKPTQISKIVEAQHNSRRACSVTGRRIERLGSSDDDNEDEYDEEEDEDAEDEEQLHDAEDADESDEEQVVTSQNTRIVKRNGMIQSIVTELKSAKVSKGNCNQSQQKPDHQNASLSSSGDQRKRNQQQNHNNDDDEYEQDEADEESAAIAEEEDACCNENDDEVLLEEGREEGNDHANNLDNKDDELGGGARSLRKRHSIGVADSAYLQGIVMMSKGRKSSTSSSAGSAGKKGIAKRLQQQNNKKNTKSSLSKLGRNAGKQIKVAAGDDDEEDELDYQINDGVTGNNGHGEAMVTEAGDEEEDSYSEDGIDMKNVVLRKRSGSGNEEQQCALCSYSCADRSTLLRHMRKHSGERPYQCRLCSFGFTTKANCERHLRNRHGQVDRSQIRNLIECHLPNKTSNDGSDLSDENETGSQSQNGNKTFTSHNAKQLASSTMPENKASVPQLSYNNGPLFNPAFIPTSTQAAALLSTEFQKSAPFMMHHPMFFSAAAAAAAASANNNNKTGGSDFPGLTIANAHSNNSNSSLNSKRNLFLDSLGLGHFLSASAAHTGGLEFTKPSIGQQQQQSAALELTTSANKQHGLSQNNAAPLDLSMDAVDLSVRRQSSKKGSGEKVKDLKALPKPKPVYPIDSLSQGLVTSPFVSKREPIVHPQLPLANFSVQNALQSADLHVNNLGSSVPTSQGPFSLFPFANPNLTPANFPYGIPTPGTIDKYMGLGSTIASHPSKSHPFMSSSPPVAPVTTASFGSSSDVLTIQTSELLSGNKMQQRPGSAKSSSLSPNPVSSSRIHKRSDKRRDFQKPKQRRYRTERPFACPHCPAKFTLRSNMERHGKHQHPAVWQRSPSNRVINRQKNLANQQPNTSPFLSSPTMVPTSKFSATNGYGYNLKQSLPNRKSDIDAFAAANSINVRAVIAQQLKRKMSGTDLRLSHNIKMEAGSEDDGESSAVSSYINENGPGRSVMSPSDLASVSQLVDRAKSSNFAQFFNNNNNDSSTGGTGSGGEGENSSSHNRDRSDTESNHGSSTSDADEEDPEDEDYDEDDENEVKRMKLAQNKVAAGGVGIGKQGKGSSGEKGNGEKKKKSAYSSAPHKISCPHCTRRFPWTSSLRRHLLTHTGQKPYQCSQCPLLFTTKSNCDRHLVRKHNGNRNGDGRGRRGRKRKDRAVGTGGTAGDGVQASAVGTTNTTTSPMVGSISGTVVGTSDSGLGKTKEVGETRAGEADSAGDEDEHESEGESSSQNEENSQDEQSNVSKTQLAKSATGSVLPTTSTPVSTSKIISLSSSNSSSPGDDVAFRCHLCDASSVERDVLLSHMQEEHKDTFQLLVAKGALVNSPIPQSSSTSPQSENNSENDSIITSAMASAAVTTPLSVGSDSQKDLTHRKVICVFCVRRFWSVEDLRRHIRSHSGERPFSCPHCSRRFTLKHSMLRHVKKHVSRNKQQSGANNAATTMAAPPVTSNRSTGSRLLVSNSLVNLVTSTNNNNNNANSTLANNLKTDLIGRLLGINDDRLVEELLSKGDAKDAAELLGLNNSINNTTTTITTSESSPSPSAGLVNTTPSTSASTVVVSSSTN